MGEFRDGELATLRTMQPVFSSAWRNSLNEARAAGSPVLLTARENNVLQYMLDGMSDKLICRELGLALPTVKCHVKNILRKTGASGRTEVVARYLRAGWVN